MKNKRIYLVLIILICITIIALLPKYTYAALQANPNTHYSGYKRNSNQWISEIRQMEAPNNAMGLVESFKSDLTPTTSNNIDVHMMKSTEYGAIAILAVSGYGNPQTMQASSIKTTTGNTTGVYYTPTPNNNSNNVNIYAELVAAEGNR